jgi:hypothetical protein
VKALGARRSALGALACYLVPISVGLLLFSAAALKGYELFAAPLPETSLWTSHAFRVGAIEVESALGLWLLSGVYPRRVRWVALAAFLVFLAASLYRALAGQETCGCFGRVPLHPRWTAAIDFVVILALWRWHPTKGMGPLVGRRWFRLTALLFILLCIAVPGGVLLAVSRLAVLDGEAEIGGNQSVIVVKPEKWLGRRCPLLPYVDIGDELSRGRWLVVLYHHDCPICREVVPAYEAKARVGESDPTAPRVAFLAVPPHGAPLWQFAPGRSCLKGRLTESKEWFVVTPAVIRLQDGVVQPETAPS